MEGRRVITSQPVRGEGRGVTLSPPTRVREGKGSLSRLLSSFFPLSPFRQCSCVLSGCRGFCQHLLMDNQVINTVGRDVRLLLYPFPSPKRLSQIRVDEWWNLEVSTRWKLQDLSHVWFCLVQKSSKTTHKLVFLLQTEASYMIGFQLEPENHCPRLPHFAFLQHFLDKIYVYPISTILYLHSPNC